MAKRFTESAKWDDPWFVSLTPQEKLAWVYLADKCDAAGVCDLSEPLAAFHLGGSMDWAGFLAKSEGRIVRLHKGKLWLTKFVAWQYGELSESCIPHRAVLKLIEKHGLDSMDAEGLANPSPTLAIPLANPSPRVLDKDKDKDKDKDLEGGAGETKPAKSPADPIPANFSLPLREAVSTWLRYKSERNERYKPTGLRAFFGEVANVAKENGESVVIRRMTHAMAQGWKGWNHAEKEARGSPGGGYDRQAVLDQATREVEEELERRRAKQADRELSRRVRAQT